MTKRIRYRDKVCEINSENPRDTTSNTDQHRGDSNTNRGRVLTSIAPFTFTQAFINSEMLCCFRRWDLRCCHYPHSAQSFVAVNAMLARVFILLVSNFFCLEMIRGFALRTTHSICTCGCRDRASTTNAATVLPTLPLSVLSLNATSAQAPILVKFSRHVLSGLWSHR